MTRSEQVQTWLESHEQRFPDRTVAGRALAAQLGAYADRQDVIVLALPRGGVPVAFEVARALGVPLDLLLVRKLGVPGQKELAMGAIAEGGVHVLNPTVVIALRIPPEVIELVAADEVRELDRRARAYRGERPPPDLRGRTVILIDDGLATGTTMRAAIVAVRARGAARVVVAVPVAAPDTVDELSPSVDDIVALLTPEPFAAIGLWYRDFSQLSDDQVRNLLAQARELNKSV
jgi:putative phosphoribosyl transferase